MPQEREVPGSILRKRGERPDAPFMASTFFIAKHNISVKYASSPANGRYNLGYAPRASVMSAFYGFVLNINPFSPYLFHIYFYS